MCTSEKLLFQYTENNLLKSVIFVNIQISNDFKLQTFWKLRFPKNVSTISDQRGTIHLKMWEPNMNKLTSTGEDVSINGLNVDVRFERVSLISNTSFLKGQ